MKYTITGIVVLLLAHVAAAEPEASLLAPAPMVGDEAVEIAERNVETYPHIPLAGSDDREILHWMDIGRLNENSPVLARWQTRSYFNEPAGRGNEDMGFTQHRLHVRGAIGAIDEPWHTQGWLDIDAMHMHSRPTLPDTGEGFPKKLWDIQAGGSAIWPYPPGHYTLAIGSASDQPFASLDEMTFDFTWAFGELGDEREVQSGPVGLVWFVNWQNNRDYCNWLLVPGFQLVGKMNPTLKFAVGFPVFSLTWTPTERLTLAGTFEYPRTVFTRATYDLADGVSVYGGFEWDNQRWYRHDREHERWRLWYDEKRFASGLDWQINDHIKLEVESGYAFDRMWFEGEEYRNREHNRLNVDDGLFAGLSLRIDW
jgi:hypothetical protein